MERSSEAAEDTGAVPDTHVGIRALKQNASEVVARVKLGAPAVVTERGVPVAKIVPLQSTPLADLIGSGNLKPARISMAEFFARRAGWDLREPTSSVAAQTQPLTTGTILDELRGERL